MVIEMKKSIILAILGLFVLCFAGIAYNLAYPLPSESIHQDIFNSILQNDSSAGVSIKITNKQEQGLIYALSGYIDMPQKEYFLITFKKNSLSQRYQLYSCTVHDNSVDTVSLVNSWFSQYTVRRQSDSGFISIKSTFRVSVVGVLIGIFCISIIFSVLKRKMSIKYSQKKNF